MHAEWLLPNKPTQPYPAVALQQQGSFYTYYLTIIYPRMIMKGILPGLLLLLLVSASTQAQVTIFSQNFNSSAVLTDYFNSNAPNAGQFNGYANSLVSSGQTAPITSIANNRLSIDRSATTAAPSLSVTRSTVFSTTPKVMQFECDLEITNMVNGSNVAVSFEVGSGAGFSATTAGALSNTYVHSRFALATNTTAGVNSFYIRRVSPGTNSTNFFTGQQHITWVVNNSGSTFTYTAPDGSSKTIGDDQGAVWAGTTLVFDSIVPLTATTDIKNIRITSGAGNMIMLLDNIVIKALDANPLPVSITSFTGKAGNQGVQLNWATATEINNDHFTIERSADAVTFNPIITVPAKGIAATYTVTDQHPLDGINYYRLVQYDKDGTNHYYGSITVNTTGIATATLSAYPNPAKDHVTLKVDHYTGKSLSLVIRDLTGKIISTQVIATNSIQPLYNITLPGTLLSGLYFLELTGEDFHQSTKLVIQ